MQRKVIWQRVDKVGMELCFLYIQPDGASMDGTVITAFEDEPVNVRYFIQTGSDWWTSDVTIWFPTSESLAILRLQMRNQQWQVDGQERNDLANCIDVDLGITPSTNTLPIRRLNLAVGESAEVTAAWVRFPELSVEPLRQRYTRLAPDRYLYESLESGFTAELSVDESGLVTHYPGGWTLWTPESPSPRIARSSEAPPATDAAGT